MVEKDPQTAFLMGSATSGVLTAGMLPRFLKTQKMMPTGLVALLGVAGLLHNGNQLSKWWDPASLPFSSSK